MLVDKDNHVLSTGYNGVPAGRPHCNQVNGEGVMAHLCTGALSSSGTNLAGCSAVHAEINALISCRNPEDAYTAYVTASPCLLCIGPLLNSACEEIVFMDFYPHRDAEHLWTSSGRKWIHHVPSWTVNSK